MKIKKHLSWEPGSSLNQQNTCVGAYRYGFNGKENDNEVKGVGDQQDYGKRIYDPRVGRFLSVDPITGKYPELTPYQFASNTPIWAVDQDGLEAAHIYYWAPMTFPQIQRDFKAAGQVLKGVGNVAIGIIGALTQMGGAAEYGDKVKPADWSQQFPSIPNNDIVKDGVVPIFMTPAVTAVRIKDDPTNGEAWGEALAIFAGAMTMSAESPLDASATSQTPKGLQVGPYGDMRALNAGTGLSADHIPSFGALRSNLEQSLGRVLTKAEQSQLRSQSLTLVYETEIHQKFSRTYGGRNNATKIEQDASNLYKAVRWVDFAGQ